MIRANGYNIYHDILFRHITEMTVFTEGIQSLSLTENIMLTHIHNESSCTHSGQNHTEFRPDQ